MDKITYKGYEIEILQDDDPTNPREDDNLGTMICFHKRYSLGDKHSYQTEDYSSWAEMLKAIEKKEGKLIALPLYLYDHSGITMKTSPFSCPWDSGQVGFIFITLEKARSEFSKKAISPSMRKKLEGYLESEVKTYDHYLTGDVWGYNVSKNGDETDSCWGFYGDTAYCLEEAKAAVDANTEHDSKKAA